MTDDQKPPIPEDLRGMYQKYSRHAEDHEATVEIPETLTTLIERIARLEQSRDQWKALALGYNAHGCGCPDTLDSLCPICQAVDDLVEKEAAQ